MIGFVRGKVLAFGIDYCLVDTGAIGYRINFFHPESLKIGLEVMIYTYQNVREDEISLYGFLSLDEYELFTKLISVKGLGPKIASNILAATTIEAIKAAIENNDVAFMKSLPGVGAKTASQMILDLKGKLVDKSAFEQVNAKMQDVIEALKALGYKASEINPIIKQIEKEDLTTDAYIKKALALLLK